MDTGISPALLSVLGYNNNCLSVLQDLNKMQFHFKDKEKPRGYTCSLAALLHVSYNSSVAFTTYWNWIALKSRKICIEYGNDTYLS